MQGSGGKEGFRPKEDGKRSSIVCRLRGAAEESRVEWMLARPAPFDLFIWNWTGLELRT